MSSSSSEYQSADRFYVAEDSYTIDQVRDAFAEGASDDPFIHIPTDPDQGSDDGYVHYYLQPDSESVVTLIGEEEIPYNQGDFPNHVNEVYRYQVGMNDSDHWTIIGRINDEYYFKFDAWCDYTGFDCQGGMKLYLSRSLEKIYKYA